MPSEHDLRVLILMPTSRDAERTSRLLCDARHACHACKDVRSLAGELEQGAGALLIAEEYLRGNPLEELRAALRAQPAWSSIPIIVLTHEAGDPSPHRSLNSGNVTLVERPVRVRSLISVIDAAIRARRHQYQIRDLLAQHERQAEELRVSENRYRTLVEQVRDHAIFSTDPNGIPTSWNEGVRRVLGFEEHEFIGNDVIHAIFTPEDLQANIPEKEFAHAATHGAAGNDRWMRRKEGERFFAMGSTTALRDGAGGLIGFSKVMRDATEWKEATDALRQADRQKDEFLAMLSHELRNPLSPIRSGLDLLQLESTQPDETLELMQHQLDHLVRLVDDLLDVSRIVQGKINLRLETVELSEMVRRSIEAIFPTIQQQKHELSVTTPAETIWLRADPVRLEQVIANLLNNASKYTPPGGRIEVSVTSGNGEGVLKVKDNGIGIDADLLPNVFDLFTQASRSLDRSQGGLGVGLTVVRTLVQLHGGTIEADSAGPGAGSTFTVRLPIAQAPAPSEQPAQADERRGALRILAVDDNVGAATLLGRLLKLLGNHEVVLAHDGPTALQKAKEFHPDLILLDIGLPGMDGYQVARSLRATAELKHVRLIALTGYGQDEDRQKSKAAGFDAHLTKPPAVQELRNILGHAS